MRGGEGEEKVKGGGKRRGGEGGGSGEVVREGGW